MLELDVVDNNDLKMQMVTTLQSTSAGKRMYAELCERQIALRELVRCLSEPWHDKTNKMAMRPAKTQISLGIRPVWSESSLFVWRNLGSLATH